ncbi:unnamed protein product [Ectocarpus sp. 4 AP-2014]
MHYTSTLFSQKVAIILVAASRGFTNSKSHHPTHPRLHIHAAPREKLPTNCTEGSISLPSLQNFYDHGSCRLYPTHPHCCPSFFERRHRRRRKQIAKPWRPSLPRRPLQHRRQDLIV